MSILLFNNNVISNNIQNQTKKITLNVNGKVNKRRNSNNYLKDTTISFTFKTANKYSLN